MFRVSSSRQSLVLTFICLYKVTLAYISSTERERALS